MKNTYTAAERRTMSSGWRAPTRKKSTGLWTPSRFVRAARTNARWMFDPVTVFAPMRPGRSVPTRALLPKGWLIQPKWNDERAILVGGTLYNRHGERFAPFKARAFALPEEADTPLDLLLIGFRTGSPRRIIILDRPFAKGGYRERNPDADVWEDPEECWRLFGSNPEVEGLVARHPEAPYCFGNSVNLVKWKV